MRDDSVKIHVSAQSKLCDAYELVRCDGCYIHARLNAELNSGCGEYELVQYFRSVVGLAGDASVEEVRALNECLNIAGILAYLVPSGTGEHTY